MTNVETLPGDLSDSHRDPGDLATYAGGISNQGTSEHDTKIQSEASGDPIDFPERFILYNGVEVIFQRLTSEHYGDMIVRASTEWLLQIHNKSVGIRTLNIKNPNRANLVTLFLDLIENELGANIAGWIRRLNNPSPNEIPPWKREPEQRVRTWDVKRHTFDDEGNANRFEDECKGWLVYDHNTKEWYSWNINHWKQARGDENLSARVVGRSVIKERERWKSCFDGKELLKFDNHADRAASKKAQVDMLSMVKDTLSIDLQKETKKSLLACQNGIIDTETGNFYELWECDELREQYPLAYIDCTYIKEGVSEEWIHHLMTIMNDNTTEGLEQKERNERQRGLVKYLLRLFGYILYPGNPERIFVFFYGNGRNGKSTTTTILQEILGDEAKSAALAQLYSGNTDKPAPSVADALPSRLAIFSEADGDSPLSTSAFKDLTGEKSSSRWRRMHANNTNIPILCLPIGTTNEMPHFDKEIGQAMLNRLVTVPFRHEFPSETRGVTDKLLRDKDLIFSMMVDELRLYLKDGLQEVPQCARVTKQEILVGPAMYEYFTEAVIPAEDERLTYKELKEDYLKWCIAKGIDVRTRKNPDWTFEGDADIPRIILSQNEVKLLYNAARIMGFKETKYLGTPCFRAKKRTEIRIQTKII